MSKRKKGEPRGVFPKRVSEYGLPPLGGHYFVWNSPEQDGPWTRWKGPDDREWKDVYAWMEIPPAPPTQTQAEGKG